MSAGQRPRSPAHFPRMKVRGHRRRARAEFARMQLDGRLQFAIDQILDLITDAFNLPRVNTRDIFAPDTLERRT